jgi:hypothetical protein
VKQDKINVNTCWRFDFEHPGWGRDAQAHREQLLKQISTWLLGKEDVCELRCTSPCETQIWVWHKAQAAQLRMLACGFDPKVKKTSRPNPRLATKKTYRVFMHVERREVSTIEAVSLEKAREIASKLVQQRRGAAHSKYSEWWCLDLVERAIETTETT